jgi:hypothetical protein
VWAILSPIALNASLSRDKKKGQAQRRPSWAATDHKAAEYARQVLIFGDSFLSIKQDLSLRRLQGNLLRTRLKGAVYVGQLDFGKRKAYVKPADVDYFTDPIRYTQVPTRSRPTKKSWLGKQPVRMGTYTRVR